MNSPSHAPPADAPAAPRRRAFLQGCREAIGTPSLVLGASFVGFGSLVRESGMSLWLGLASTLSTWALPGQIVMVELYAVGASLVAITVAVALTNARLMPMTVTLLPMLREREVPRWQYYLIAHLIAVTSWAGGMRRCPELPLAERRLYFLGYAAVLWAVSLGATAAGFLLAGSVPPPVTLGLVFLNPVYFMLLFANDYRQRARLLALCLGGAMGPALHLVTPNWGLMITGVVAGTLAFAADRWAERRRRRGGG